MGCGKVFVVVSAVFCGILGYYLYVPIPPGVTDPWVLRIFSASSTMMRDISIVGEYFGFGSRYAIMTSVLTKMMLVMGSSPRDNLRVTDTTFDGVKVRIYQPAEGGKDQPALVYYHGGGFVMCNIDTYDALTRTLARELNMVVVSVEYRLAPEHTYPIPLLDCEAATVHFFKNAAKYGVDPKRIAIGGDIAGGQLSAALSLKFRDTPGQQMPKLQLLLYPATQYFDFNLPAHHQNEWHIFYLLKTKSLASIFLKYIGIDQKYTDAVAKNNHTTPEMKKTYNKFVGIRQIPKEFIPKDYIVRVKNFGDSKLAKLIGSKVLDPYVSPLLAESVGGLPHAYILTCEMDTLRDDGILYKQRLEKEGTKVTWDHYDDGWHGMLNVIDGPLASAPGTRALRNIVFFLKKNL